MKNFECEICESKENPQSDQWEEMCVYCNENCLIANLEMIRSQIKYYERTVLLDRCAICDNENDLCAGHIGGELN